jgi:hypothetical protein
MFYDFVLANVNFCIDPPLTPPVSSDKPRKKEKNREMGAGVGGDKRDGRDGRPRPAQGPGRPGGCRLVATPLSDSIGSCPCPVELPPVS